MLSYVSSPKVKPSPEQVAWIASQNGDFVQSLYSQFQKSGVLSEKQVACIVRGMDPKQPDTKGAKAPQARFKLGGDGLDKLEQAFAKVKSGGAKKPKLIIDGLVFKPAPMSGKNPNAIYVVRKDDSAYLGKISDGTLLPVQGVPVELALKIADICADPFGYAVNHGLMTGECSCCGKTLSDPKSIAAGIGPVCAKKWGW
jgi:hypothetical protein